jgi:LAO/AO transport system ATPase
MSARNNPNRVAQRILLAKVGLDGHDRGIKVVARGLRDAGFHVIYGGIWQSPEAVARAAVDEDADWVGLSLLSGAHMVLVPRVLDALRKAGADRTRVIVGGIVPAEDIAKLKQLGVAHVFGPGTSIEEIVRVFEAGGDAVPGTQSSVPSTQYSVGSALAHAITQAARGERVDIREVETQGDRSDAKVVAVTGSAGIGKSSLVGKLIGRIRAAGKTVAVLACDPESPLTGGALLGDRVRMTLDDADEGVFMRSLAVPSGQQAIASHLDAIVELTEAFGFDIVLLETGGAGQGDTAVRELADTVVLLLQPEAGDELQWQKAGLLEIADIVVIHKADLPGAERVEAEVREQLNLPGFRQVPVLRVSAKTGDGIDRLWQAIEAGRD